MAELRETNPTAAASEAEASSRPRGLSAHLLDKKEITFVDDAAIGKGYCRPEAMLSADPPCYRPSATPHAIDHAMVQKAVDIG